MANNDAIAAAMALLTIFDDMLGCIHDSNRFAHEDVGKLGMYSMKNLVLL